MMIPVCGLEEKLWLFIRRDLIFFCPMPEVTERARVHMWEWDGMTAWISKNGYAGL